MNTNYLLLRFAVCILLACSIALPVMAQIQTENVDPQSEEIIKDENDTRFLPISSLINHNVKNTDREDIGTFDDILFDPVTGKIAYAILASGGFLGFYETHHAIPISLIDHHTTEGEEYCVVKINTQKLKDAPTYNLAQEQNQNDTSFDKTISSYYEIDEVSTNQLVSWKDVSEKNVTNDATENIGTLSDMLFTETEGQVIFVTVSTSMSSELDKNRIIVPFKSIQFNTGAETHTILASNEKLKNAPSGYDKEGKLNANTSDPDWQQTIYEYYSVNSVFKSDSQNITANNIIGMKVQNSKGEEVGHIQNINFDNEMSKITSFTVTIGGFLEISDKQVQINREKFSLNETNEMFILNISNDELLGIVKM